MFCKNSPAEGYIFELLKLEYDPRSVNEEKIMPTLVDHLQKELMDLARKQSFKEGFEKASEQLRSKFLQEGRQEGRQEVRIEAAKVLFSNGVPIDIITETTKLSKKEIKKLVHEEGDDFSIL